MMVMATFIGISAGKRLFSSSSCYPEITEKLVNANDYGATYYQHQHASTRNVIVTKKTSDYGASYPSSRRISQKSVKALNEHVNTVPAALTAETWFRTFDDLEDESADLDYSVEALLLLQKYMLEKQWNLSSSETIDNVSPSNNSTTMIHFTRSGVSARQRRIRARKRNLIQNRSTPEARAFEQINSLVTPELLQNRSSGYVKGVLSEELLTHGEVVRLSRLIQWGLALEDHKFRMKERLGYEPTDDQVAASLKISRTELRSQLIACSFAKDKLAMSNVRLVMSIAQRFSNKGVEMSDLVQGGLTGLLRGIEKFDSSKGFKFSTYAYWWIRQGVTKTFVDNSRILRLPNHLHERLGLIRNAKHSLEEKGITPSIEKIAETLNISQKKVRNATEGVCRIFSLDRDPFPSLNGIPGDTHHSYIADKNPENNPWYGVQEWALKNEMNDLINETLQERERQIVRLYYGLDKECLTWEEISKRIGLSRERVRQLGLVSVEKLKLAARKKRMSPRE